MEVRMNGTVEGRSRADRVSGYAVGGDRGGRDQERERRAPRPAPRLALGLGLLGVGLGLAELFAPRRLNRFVGIADRRRAVARLTGAAAAVVGVTALDLYAAATSRGRERAVDAGPVRGAVTIAVTPDRAFAFWRDLRNLSAFMDGVESIEEVGGGRSRWRVRGPLGRVLAWDAEIVEELPGERLRWRSLPGGDVSHVGEVRFRKAPGDRGVEVTVELSYLPPAGELGRAASSFADQAMTIRLERDLGRLKQILELGQVVHSDASIHAGRHAAQPSKTARTT
jgi:uncharacterized membrane protein